MKPPYYFGGMILSDINEAYDYEIWLRNLLIKRYEKYQKKWSMYLGMLEIWHEKKKKYKYNDYHPIPEDGLIATPDIVEASPILNLKRKHLVMLEFEALKFYRRKKYFPFPSVFRFW